MRKPRPSDARQLSPGESVALLVGSYDPPTMDYFRAADALFFAKGMSCVWLCPLAGEKGSEQRARELLTIFGVEFMAATRKQASCCSIALDKGMRRASEILDWCQVNYPFLVFKVASIGGLAGVKDQIFVRLAGQKREAPPGAQALSLDFVPAPHDIRSRIKRGSDESRNFTPAVWARIASKGYYR